MIIYNVYKLFRKVSVIWLMFLDFSLKGRGVIVCDILLMKYVVR